jgi:hypothetical protein
MLSSPPAPPNLETIVRPPHASATTQKRQYIFYIFLIARARPRNCNCTILQLQFYNYNFTIAILQLQFYNYNFTITIYKCNFKSDNLQVQFTSFAQPQGKCLLFIMNLDRLKMTEKNLSWSQSYDFKLQRQRCKIYSATNA